MWCDALYFIIIFMNRCPQSIHPPLLFVKKKILKNFSWKKAKQQESISSYRSTYFLNSNKNTLFFLPFFILLSNGI